MKKLLITGLLVAAAGSWAQTSTVQSVTDKAKALADKAKTAAVAVTLCDTCGTVQTVQQEKRKGKGGVLGVAGGAVAGGLLGNQVGKGTGNTVATVGGAVAGGVRVCWRGGCTDGGVGGRAGGWGDCRGSVRDRCAGSGRLWCRSGPGRGGVRRARRRAWGWRGGRCGRRRSIPGLSLIHI